MTRQPRFALIGAAGFVAPRHLEAIKSVGGKLVAALDLHDAVGILDRYDRETEFFTDEHRFERHLEKLRRDGNGIDWLTVCSPNHLHDVHSRLGLHLGANVICEKPLVLNPWNLDALAEAEHRTGRRVYTVLQLRYAPALVNLYNAAQLVSPVKQHKVILRYVTPRGRWYHQSWKGDESQSGGLIMNIGIHMLDALMWIWGKDIGGGGILDRSSTSVTGDIVLERAYVEFDLSLEGDRAIRTLEIDGYGVDFNTGFESLHNTVYAETLAGRGHGVEDARAAVELAYRLRRNV